MTSVSPAIWDAVPKSDGGYSWVMENLGGNVIIYGLDCTAMSRKVLNVNPGLINLWVV